MRTWTIRKANMGSLVLGVPPIAWRLVRSWSRSVMARGERWACASLASMGMQAAPGTFLEAGDPGWGPDRLA
jgi:hypothetical protein